MNKADYFDRQFAEMEAKPMVHESFKTTQEVDKEASNAAAMEMASQSMILINLDRNKKRRRAIVNRLSPSKVAMPVKRLSPSKR